MPTNQEKHTPGPWSAQQLTPDRWTIVADQGVRRYHIATVENGQPGDTLETEGATARLMAAAPELLACLKEARIALGRACNKSTSTGDLGRMIPIIEESEAAIAKAEGKP